MNRLFEHGAADTLSSVPFMAGPLDIPDEEPGVLDRGRLLVEAEFLCRYGHPNDAVVYSAAPSYLEIISKLFPVFKFIAFGYKQEEYNPCSSDDDSPFPNVTVLESDLSRDMATLLKAGQTLLIHSPAQQPMRQLVLHRQVQPRFSLFTLSKLIPEEFISGTLFALRKPKILNLDTGDLYYPLYPKNPRATTVFLVSPKHAVTRVYWPNHLLDELAFFQALSFKIPW